MPKTFCGRVRIQSVIPQSIDQRIQQRANRPGQHLYLQGKPPTSDDHDHILDKHQLS